MSNTSSKRIDNPLKIGLTGGIGSGKSLVSSIFEILGVPVFKADKVVKDLYNSDQYVKDRMTLLFGTGVYTREGFINRDFLAHIIFNDSTALQDVHNLVHPLVYRAFVEWHLQQKAFYILHEAAILFESGFHRMMDATILVTAPEEVRIQRVMNRDHVSRDHVMARMRNQWKDEKKASLTDYLINNDEKHLLIEQILEADKKIKAHGKIC